MKTNQIAGRCVLACVFVYLLIQIYYLSNYIVPSATKEPWRDLQLRKRENTSPFDALLLVNSEGKIKREVLLSDKHSFLITGAKNGRDVFIESIHDPDSDRYLYGVCNLVNGRWYFETMTASRPIGLKRGNENVIYRLKEGMLYQLDASDVIYADTCKIVIREQKNIWRD